MNLSFKFPFFYQNYCDPQSSYLILIPVSLCSPFLTFTLSCLLPLPVNALLAVSFSFIHFNMFRMSAFDYITSPPPPPLLFHFQPRLTVFIFHARNKPSTEQILRILRTYMSLKVTKLTIKKEVGCTLFFYTLSHIQRVYEYLWSV